MAMFLLALNGHSLVSTKKSIGIPRHVPSCLHRKKHAIKKHPFAILLSRGWHTLFVIHPLFVIQHHGPKLGLVSKSLGPKKLNEIFFEVQKLTVLLRQNCSSPPLWLAEALRQSPLSPKAWHPKRASKPAW